LHVADLPVAPTEFLLQAGKRDTVACLAQRTVQISVALLFGI